MDWKFFLFSGAGHLCFIHLSLSTCFATSTQHLCDSCQIYKEEIHAKKRRENLVILLQKKKYSCKVDYNVSCKASGVF